MRDSLSVFLFAEDGAHEALLVPLTARIASDEGVRSSLRVVSAQGGHGRAIQELRTWQHVRSRVAVPTTPDLLVVAIDTNCGRFVDTRQQIRDAMHPDLCNALVTACPEPHIERWYMADPESFNDVVGSNPNVGREKCARERYKKILMDAIGAAGYPTALLEGTDFALDIATKMDLYRAGKNCPSLGTFVQELRMKIRRITTPSV